MSRKRETRPAAGKHSGRARKSNDMVAQNEETLWTAALFALFVFSVLVLPHIMYYFIAPMKGWC